ncbi:MAG: hypothetical protein AAF939_10795 [Planctomycetota bacterium]
MLELFSEIFSSKPTTPDPVPSIARDGCDSLGVASYQRDTPTIRLGEMVAETAPPSFEKNEPPSTEAGN